MAIAAREDKSESSGFRLYEVEKIVITRKHGN